MCSITHNSLSTLPRIQAFSSSLILASVDDSYNTTFVCISNCNHLYLWLQAEKQASKLGRSMSSIFGRGSRLPIGDVERVRQEMAKSSNPLVHAMQVRQ